MTWSYCRIENGIESGIESGIERYPSNGNSKRCTRGISMHMLQNGGKITEH